MSLARRIKKLQSQGNQVNVKKYYLFDVDGYRSHEAVRNFWIGICGFSVLLFILFWLVSGIITSNKNSSNVELRKLNNEKQSSERLQLEKDKQQYVDSCKNAGKSPTDMGDRKEFWECR